MTSDLFQGLYGGDRRRSTGARVDMDEVAKLARYPFRFGATLKMLDVLSVQRWSLGEAMVFFAINSDMVQIPVPADAETVKVELA